MNTYRLLAAMLLGIFLVGCGQSAATTEPDNNTQNEAATSVPQPTNTMAPTTTATAVSPTATVATPSVPTVAFSPVFETSACQFALPNGREVTCGYLTVPEDQHNVANGRTVRLHVAIFASENDEPAPDPMIYLSGGPGGDALESVPYNFDAVFAPYLVERDLILFDQRGTGYAEPSLACPEYTEMVFDHLNEILETDELVALALETIFTCHDRLQAEDINLAVYNSAQSAADVAMLRQALGYDEWNLYGASYGTRLAQTIMRDHPDGVRSVILDSTYPVAGNMQIDTPHNVKQAMDRFFAACAADPDCGAAYPDLENTFWELVAQLNETPRALTVPNLLTGQRYDTVADGNALIGQLFQALYNPEMISLFPQLIYELKAGNSDLLSGFMANSLAKLDFISLGMTLSVQCHEEIYFSDPDEVATAVSNYPELEEIFNNSITSGLLGLPLCAEWGAGTPDPIENEMVRSDIPTLILHGEFDPVTPPAWGATVTEGLSHHFFYEIPGQGHGPGLAHECPRSMVLAFLKDPAAAPDDHCLAEMKMTFVTPVDTAVIPLSPVTLPEYGLQAEMPEGWLEAAPEYRVAPDRTIELVVKDKRDESLETVLVTLNAGEVILEVTANGLVWEVRDIAIPGSEAVGYFATTPSAQGFYLVLLVTTPDKKEELLEPLFLPVVESVRPIDE